VLISKDTVRAAGDPTVLTVVTVRAASDLAALTVDGCISGCILLSSSSSHSLHLAKKRMGGLGLLLKNCSTKEEGFDLNFFGGELVEGKKMLFQTPNLSSNG
jgi:hypothetical protein